MSEPFDAINVGAGQAGPALAGRLTAAGMTAALIERNRVGGTCVNTGCTPTKSMVASAYIALEFAQMYRRFGAQVTVVETAPRLIAREDPDISDAIRAILEGEGVEVRTGATCVRLATEADVVAVGVDCTQGAPEVVGSHVLLAVGRWPNTDDLGLERAGAKTDQRGYIEVNDRLETTVSGIWALGDCNGRGAFTHTAWNDYEIVAANLLDVGDRRLSQRVPGYALYTDPPLGRVGLTETQARAAGRPLLVSSRPMSRVGRAIEKGGRLAS